MYFTKFINQLLEEAQEGNGGSGESPKQFIDLGLNTKIEIKSNETKSTEVVNNDTDDDSHNVNDNNTTLETNSTSEKAVTIINETGESIDYIYDENGNATKDGVVVYTAEQLKEFENNSDNSSTEVIDDDIHQSLTEVSGIELTDEQGNPISFKPGLEGLAEREVMVKELFYNQGKNEAINQLFQQNPDILEMYQYKVKHGSLDNFTKTLNYKTLTLGDDVSSEELKTILSDYYTSLGNTSEVVSKLVSMAEKDETLRVDALEALDKLKSIQIAKEQQEENALKEQQRIDIENFEKTYGVKTNNKGELINMNIKGSVYDKLVVEGKIGDIMIPKDGLIINIDNKKQHISRLAIFDYFYKPIKGEDGQYYSQAQIDESKRMSTTDNFLIQGIRNLSGGDISSLEKAMQNVIRIKDAKKIIRVSTKSSNTGSGKSIEEQLKDGTAKIVMH